jgi:hypothetical protein
MRRCVELLDVEYDCRPEVIRTWLSGRRSFHGTIPPRVIGAEEGHPLLPLIFASVIEQLFPPSVAPTLDRSIYSGGSGRMRRLPNRRRSDTKRYKVPLTIAEVLHKPFAELEALGTRPCKGVFWPSDEELTPCPGLVQLYQETLAAIERSSAPHRLRDVSVTGRSGDVDVLLNRCAFIRHCRDEAVTLTEPDWHAMMSNVAQCNDGAAAVHRLSVLYPGYSSEDTEGKIAHALADTGSHTCAFIQACAFIQRLGFQGCPSGGCGVKAPIALSHRQDSPLRRRREAVDIAQRILQRRTGEVAG